MIFFFLQIVTINTGNGMLLAGYLAGFKKYRCRYRLDTRNQEWYSGWIELSGM
jgi:hypothetical protein